MIVRQALFIERLVSLVPEEYICLRETLQALPLYSSDLEAILETYAILRPYIKPAVEHWQRDVQEVFRGN